VRDIQVARAEDEKIDTYKQTIISQEAVIQKLERVVKKSLKDVKSAQDNQLALEKLRLENIQLRTAANTFAQEPQRRDEELRFEIQRSKERIASLEKQLIEAAKSHGQQLASLQLSKEN
jgi:septal ring factor EnvC (AmiA/AmiB activator)